MKHILTILSLLISSYCFSQNVTVKVPQQDISGKMDKADSALYATQTQLAKKQDSSYHDTTDLIAPLYSTTLSKTHSQLKAYMSTDSTFSDASDSTLASSLAIKRKIRSDSTVLQTGLNGKLSSTNFVFNEVPAGSINGSNTTFTIANTPITGTVNVLRNGLLQQVGSGNDYTISGVTITFITAPETGDAILVNYLK